MLFIYTETISNRLDYTLDFIFKSRGIEYVLCDDFVVFERLDGQRLNYSDRHFESIKKIIPSPLLFDQKIRDYDIKYHEFNGVDCLQFDDVADPLSSIFYILTRMEEYNSKLRDKHGRFEGKNSTLFRYDWHEKAICDRWSESILDFLSISSKSNSKDFQFLPTFDIDNAYAYKHKGFIRSSLANLRDFITGHTRRLLERQNVQSGLKKDPFDTYDIIEDTIKNGYNALLFWLLGDYAKFDKNLSYKHPKHQKIIRRMNEHIEIGIHPSYKSTTYYYYLHQEIERLEEIIDKRVHKSRQHYLKLEFPLSYQSLIDNEITDDYTMGYADIAGFRAGTAHSFLWFDLSTNAVTSLRIHPFVYMDGTLNQYLKLSPNEAKEKIQQLWEEVKRYGGDFIFIWHNETLGEKRKWKGWLDVYYFTLELKNK
jgi:hypothetical protein